MVIKKIIMRFFGEEHFQKIRDVFYRFFPSTKTEMLKRKQFYTNFVKKDDLCFDVGANFGNRIVPFLEIGAKVVAVEPQEPCYKYIQKKFGDKIFLEKKGLCDEECVRDFYISRSRTISSFSKEWIDAVKETRFKDYVWGKPTTVEMTTLDNLIKKYGSPDYIKIDVEGYELEVIKGLSTPVKMISFEYTVPEQFDMIEKCIKSVEKVNRNIKCNYSIGETMEWAGKEWITVSEFLEVTKTKDFINTGFGDIYLRHGE